MMVSRADTRILVVDDDDDIRMIVRMMLTLAGFAVVAESRDGAEALRHVEALSPDVVILDRQMPRLTGEKAAARIREISSSVRIFALSANLDAKPEWADAWLPKFSIGRLPEAIDKLRASI